MSSLNHPRRRFGKLFGDLRVRPKLIVLHNLFFLVLTCAAYFSLIPLVEDRIATAREREISLARQILTAGQTPSVDAFPNYVYENGVTLVPPVPPHVKQWLDAHPGAVRSDPSAPERLYRKDPATGSYARLTIPSGFYEGSVGQAKFTLFAILGTLYLLAVALLELVIMPRHVYRPIRLTLKADEAVRDDDRPHELIDEAEIPGDEIGDIMRSRNKTVSNLRDQEAHLESALARLKQLAADLQRKNDMLEAARTKLAAQDRLASLGLLSASVAHELNTPLAVLRGSIEKLIETVDSPSTLRRLKRMQHVTDRLSGISAGLLDFSRPNREVNEPVKMRTLVDEAWSLVAIDEKASGIRFSNRVVEDTQVAGNRDRLMQLFVNLLRNAMVRHPGQRHGRGARQDRSPRRGGLGHRGRRGRRRRHPRRRAAQHLRSVCHQPPRRPRHRIGTGRRRNHRRAARRKDHGGQPARRRRSLGSSAARGNRHAGERPSVGPTE